MLWFHQNKISIVPFILIILFCVPAVLPLFHPGFFESDDGSWMVIRFSSFYEDLRHGQFPVRFLSRLNNGYGYPVADFLYPLFMYIGVPIHAIGISFVNTIKIILGGSFLLGAIFSYSWLRKFFDDASALMGSLFYTYFPYHLFDLYKRGSVGEVLSLSILPFVLWQIERGSLFFVSMGIAALIVAHNTLAFMFLPLVILYMLFNAYISKERKILFKKYVMMLFWGLLLSAFFWIPSIFDLQYTVFSRTLVSDWSSYFADIGLIGISTILSFILIAFLFLTGKLEIKRHRLTVLLFAIGLLSVFLSTQFSSLIWALLPASLIQFPFRFLSITAISSAFLTACFISLLSKKIKLIGILVILICLFISSREFISPKSYEFHPDTFYSTNQGTTTVRDEYMPRWASEIPDVMAKDKVKVIRGKGEIENVRSRGSNLSFNANFISEGVLEIATVYFPGWEAKIDGKKTNISYDNSQGLIHLNIPSGNHQVSLSFSETALRLMSDLLSLITAVGLAGWLLTKKGIIRKVK